MAPRRTPLAPEASPHILRPMRFRQLLLPFAFTLLALAACSAEPTRLGAREAAQLVQEGKAVLVDVREPAEWKDTGVAAPAVLLAKSDFDGAKAAWAPFFAQVDKDKTIVLYCRSGNRSGKVAEALAAQGYKVFNSGSLKEWAAAGLPVRKVE